MFITDYKIDRIEGMLKIEGERKGEEGATSTVKDI